MKQTAIILHGPVEKEGSFSIDESIKSIINQSEKDYDLIVIGELSRDSEAMLKESGIHYMIVNPVKNQVFSEINQMVKTFKGQNVLYIDARFNPVVLKNTCLTTFLISAERHPEAGFFYADYDLDNGKEIIEKKLLFHHIGRVRDNQDYGRVYMLRKEAMELAGYFDENIQFNHWYDMRLKISETHKLIRIGNKYSGSLYTSKASDKASNVFDYLLAGKGQQLEAETILSSHLKRIDAYLDQDVYFPVEYDRKKEAKLDATVIIPVGHRPEFIGTAIESIQAQSNPNIEAIIMVNGGAKDPTAKEVRKYMEGGSLYDPQKPEIRLEVIDINNIGLCLNIGSKLARGRYYVQLDSDDRLKADAVEKIIDVFKSNPNIGMVIGSYEVWEKKEDGKLYRMDEIPVVTHDEWTPENGRNNLLRINGAGAPRSIPIGLIPAMGYFSINDDEYARNYGEDYEMVNKIAECFEIGRIYDPIYEVVRHSGGTDHAISQDLIDRNDEAKDDMRREAIYRRMEKNVE